MEFLQEMAISHGSYFNPAYMNNLHLMSELSNITMDAPAIHGFPRPHSYNGHLDSTDLHHFHPQLAEGMDETTLLQPAVAACTTSNPLLLDPVNANSLGLCTNITSSGRQQFCEISNVGSAPAASSVHVPCKTKRRSWQEAISPPLTQTKTHISTTTHLRSDSNQLEFTSVDNILNLHHIQAAATNPNYIIPSTLTTSATVKLPLEESLIAAHEKGIPAPNPNRSSFLSALSEGDEAFFKQQLLVPMEGCTDDPMKQAATGFNTDHEDLYHQLDDPGIKHILMQHGFDDDNIVLRPMAQLWGGGHYHHQESSVVTDMSTRPSKMGSKSTGLSCVHANMPECSKDKDEKLRARQDSTYNSNASISVLGEEYIFDMCQVVNLDGSSSEPEYVIARHHVGGRKSTNKEALHHPDVEAIESKKRSLAHHDSDGYMAHSKRAHLEPQAKDCAIFSAMKHSSSSTSLSNMADSHLVNGTLKSSSASHPSKTSGKSSARNPLGPALNTNLKPRARQGTANDPQTVAARNRRERINARLKVLQELVPNGSKVDLVTMLEKAINYVKFLQLQLRVLSNDEFWQANDVEKAALQHVLAMSEEEEGVDNEEDMTYNSAQLTTCEHTSTFSNCSNIYDQP